MTNNGMRDYVRVVNGRIVPQSSWKARMALAFVCLGAILTALLIASPDAKADSNSYLTALREARYTGPDSDWLNIGYDVCQLERSNVPSLAIASKIVATTGAGVYSADAYEIIGIANSHLCNANANHSAT